MYFYTALFLSAVGRELLPCNLISERQVENRKTHHHTHTQLSVCVSVCMFTPATATCHTCHTLSRYVACLSKTTRATLLVLFRRLSSTSILHSLCLPVPSLPSPWQRQWLNPSSVFGELNQRLCCCRKL